MKNFEDVDDFNDYCQEVLSEFVNSLMKDNRYLEDYETYDNNIIKVFNFRGNQLYERFYSRLWNIGLELFHNDEDELDLQPDNYIEDVDNIW